MTPKLYGFNERRIPEILSTQVKSGDIYQRISQQESYPRPNVQYTRTWWATAKEEIAAASQGSVSGEAFTCSSGQVYILRLDRNTGKFKKETRKDGTWIERKMWNPFDTKVKIDDNVIFQVNEDRYGDIWLASPVVYKPRCQFKADSAYTTTDVSVSATIQRQWGAGFDHPSTSITVYNFLTSSNYEFYADANDYGYASYDPQNDKWWIDLPECP